MILGLSELTSNPVVIICRSAEGARRARQVGVPAHPGDRAGHVEAGGRVVVLQGHHAAGAASRAGAGDCVCGVRAGTEDHRDDADDRQRCVFGVARGSVHLRFLYIIIVIIYASRVRLL